MRQVIRSLRKGKIDPLELYEQSIERMKRLEHLNAIITGTTETAQQHAQHSSKRFRAGTAAASGLILIHIDRIGMKELQRYSQIQWNFGFPVEAGNSCAVGLVNSAFNH